MKLLRGPARHRPHGEHAHELNCCVPPPHACLQAQYDRDDLGEIFIVQTRLLLRRVELKLPSSLENLSNLARLALQLSELGVRG
jgi:hypothetical protein